MSDKDKRIEKAEAGGDDFDDDEIPDDLAEILVNARTGRGGQSDAQNVIAERAVRAEEQSLAARLAEARKRMPYAGKLEAERGRLLARDRAEQDARTAARSIGAPIRWEPEPASPPEPVVKQNTIRSAGKPTFLDAMRDRSLTTRPDDAPAPPGDAPEAAPASVTPNDNTITTDIATMYHAGKRPHG